MKVHVGRPVITCDASGTVAEAVAVEGGRIAALGRLEDVARRAGPGVEVVEHAGAVVPGFVDSHHHFALTALYDTAVDCGPEHAPTLAALRQRLAAAAGTLDLGEWLIAAHFDARGVQESRPPARSELDAISPSRPLVLMHFGFHACSANTRALEALGLDRQAPEPAAGYAPRDRRGELAGALFETASSPAEAAVEARLLARPGFAERPAAHGRRLLAAGITRVADATVSPRVEARYAALAAAGRLPLPVVMLPVGARGYLAPPVDRLDGLATGARIAPDLLVGPLKLFADGGEDLALRVPLCDVPATLRALGRALARGEAASLARLPRFRLRLARDRSLRAGLRFLRGPATEALAREAVERGFTLAIHAMGNAAVDDALDLLARVRPWHRDTPPPRIEHAYLCGDRQLRRAADLGVTLAVQPSFLALSEGVASPLPSAQILPLRAALDRGVSLAFGSDHPVVSFDPLAALRAAVTRRCEGGAAIHPEQAVTPLEALVASTREAARACGCLDECGTIEPGKRADLAVLSRDPRGLDVEGLRDLRVVATVLAGATVFSAAGSPAP
jgi:hypothetical protein